MTHWWPSFSSYLVTLLTEVLPFVWGQGLSFLFLGFTNNFWLLLLIITYWFSESKRLGQHDQNDLECQHFLTLIPSFPQPRSLFRTWCHRKHVIWVMIPWTVYLHTFSCLLSPCFHAQFLPQNDAQWLFVKWMNEWDSTWVWVAGII
jgi:hypothetical protein